ncbi:MAG TPA: efflux RND transporter periplasmic adaptor subunit [Prolixibacteraceae bacterium]|nr:efflux RND transporter periplasmic adaptor subunit [Prolixibacteraceae bacterium]
MRRQTIFLSITLIVGIFLGWVFFHSSPAKEENHDHAAETSKETIWTCAMHPQIRMHEPGKCPICGMKLIPLNQGGVTIDPDAIRMTPEAAQLANVLTSKVSKQSPVKELRLYGKVQADERLLQSQVSYLPGRIEKLLVNFTGEVVRKGQTLAVIYSPDLVTAQQELLETAATKGTQPALYEATKDKLRQWKLTEKQIEAIETSGKVKTEFEVFASATGIVSARRVNTGDYISPGSVLFDIADLSHVWIMFDAYESDLPYLTMGQKVTYTIQALPGTSYSGKITFIDPVLDPNTRIARVRIEINNPVGKLKPEMFATGIVQANLKEYKDKLVIPRTAVLWTGKRSVVYVKQAKTTEPIFKIREIELGPMLGNSYVVMNGLKDGEEIVTQGAFSVDASAQLEGKPSMMNPIGGKKASSMPGMVMPGDANLEDKKSIPGDTKSRDNKSKPGMDMPADSKPVSNASPAGNTKSQTLQVATFGVSGLCDLCKERIETAAKSVSGVSSAIWDVDTKKIKVEFNPAATNSDAVQKAIANVGHDTEKFKAPDEVYKHLPECCLYRK